MDRLIFILMHMFLLHNMDQDFGLFCFIWFSMFFMLLSTLMVLELLNLVYAGDWFGELECVIVQSG